MKSFHSFIESFIRKFQSIQIEELQIDSYPSSYLREYLNQPTYHLNIYAEVLQLSVAEKNVEELCLLDFGTGNGLLACFAKYCGVEKVIGVDYTKSFIDAAQKLSIALKLDIEFIETDENNFYELLNTNKPNVIIGTDVIEHIYSLDTFIKNCKLLNPSVQMVFTTASVNENYFKAQNLRKLQLQDEFVSSNKNQSNYLYAGLSFLEIRKKIIQESFPKLNKTEISLLATKTRGLKKDDIELVVKNYLNKNQLPEILNHPTNTCDPITGSWTERLLSIKEYKALFDKENFSIEIKKGFYNQWQKGIKNLVAKILNRCILILGKKGIVISPFIFLQIKPKTN